ncbi:hypothetical protein DFH29DRAFT_1003247 [Suillus ampliporus]|nr:hypothetical protein DFH29DRAFT_1003247 [Suillus ampliporus]
MPLRRHHQTIDLGRKLSSFMTAPPIQNTQTMDKLTNSELNRLILEERQPTNINELGHLLTYIFQSFTTEVPAAEELPWKGFASDDLVVRRFCKLSVSTYMTTQAASIVFGDLECIGYDPSINIFKHTLDQMLKSRSSWLPLHIQNKVKAKARVRGESESEGEGDSEGEGEGEGEGESKSKKQKAKSESEGEGRAENVSKGESEESEGTSSHIDTMDAKGTAKKKDNDNFPLEFPIEKPIGKIRVGDHHYDMLEIIFSSQGLVGRGTVCYLAKKDDKEFIIKDHWVLGGEKEAKNKVNMMRKMNGVRGVPKVVEHWIVESRNKIDQTANYRYKVLCSLKNTFRTHVRLILKPRARPLHQFRSRLELLSSIRDIVKIQKDAVEERNILHRDCSLNNAMIEDDGKDTHGMLIDWEFAVSILKKGNYAVGGMGTLPFMSRALLLQLHLCDPDGADERKKASDSKPNPAPLIKHTYQDDLESMFYIFIWICIKFRGPLGMKRILKQGPNWIPDQWSADKFKLCCDAKTTFFWHMEHYVKELTEQFHPYFKKLLPVTLEWYHLMRELSKVTFNDVIGMLEQHISILPIDEPSPKLLVSQWLLKGLNAEGSGSGGKEGESQSPIRETAVPRTPLTTSDSESLITNGRWK